MANFTPRIITANRLRDGAVVYLSTTGAWIETAAVAAIATGPKEQERLLLQAANSVTTCLVVDPLAIDITGPSAPIPARLREKIRSKGPTVRPDLARLT